MAMARKPAPPPRRAARPASPAPGGHPAAGSNRAKIVAALLTLLADKRLENIGLAEIARQAGVPLASVRDEFSSTLAILAAHMKDIDRAVLAQDFSDMAEEPARERLFDVLMRRLEALAPHKAAVRSLLHSASSHPSTGMAVNGLSVRSLQWMLSAADIGASGPKGMVRAQGLALLYASVLRTWVRDDDPGLARTMADLDRALARGQRWSGYLDDLCAIPAGVCRLRSRFRRRDDEPEESGESVAA
jgi:AcrR family transcriptional regulator